MEITMNGVLIITGLIIGLLVTIGKKVGYENLAIVLTYGGVLLFILGMIFGVVHDCLIDPENYIVMTCG